MSILNQSQPHFVRCMKSNMEKLGKKFDSRVMLTQLRYSGLIEVCRIRQNGFPNRFTFEKFLKTYWMLHSSAAKLQSAPELMKALERDGYLTSNDYFVGYTKIFLKFETGLLLEQARNHQVGACAVTFERIIRGWLTRRKYGKVRKALEKLKLAITAKDKSLLKIAISEASEVSADATRGGSSSSSLFSLESCESYHLAQVTLHRLELEDDTMAALENALGTSDLALLLNAVQKATMSMNPPLMNPLVTSCQEKIVELQALIETTCSESVGNIPVTPKAPFPPPPPPPRKIMRSTLRSPNDIFLTSLQSISPIISTPDSGTGRGSGFGSLSKDLSSFSPPPPPEEDPPTDCDTPVPPPPPPPPLSPADSPIPPPPSLPPLPVRTSAVAARVSERISDLTAEDGDFVSDLIGLTSADTNTSSRSRQKEKQTTQLRRHDSRSLSPKINRVEVRPISSMIQRSKSPPPKLETNEYTEKLPETLSSETSTSPHHVRRTVIRRRVSQEEFDEMKSLHEALDVIIGASDTEEGLSETDLFPLKEILTNIQSSGNELSNEVSHLMLAKEELLRAKQQIELQQQLNEMGDNAPRWKVRNRLQQAAKLGMRNFSGEFFFFSFSFSSLLILCSSP
jgi:hypothetical protein